MPPPPRPIALQPGSLPSCFTRRCIPKSSSASWPGGPPADRRPRPSARRAQPSAHSGNTTSDQQAPAAAAVCISLYNYADSIEAALAQRWPPRASHTWSSSLLMITPATTADSAASNGWSTTADSLIAPCSSNTARTVDWPPLATPHSRPPGAPWCFVLDADNTLAAEAVACCLAVAQQSPATTAVVHPLVEVVSHGDRHDEPVTADRALISGVSWQRRDLPTGQRHRRHGPDSPAGLATRGGLQPHS